MTTYRERREARADRLRGWAETRTQRAAAERAAEPAYVHDWAFITQPGHIPARARANRREERRWESERKAADMASRADGIERQLQGAIYSDDPDAIERLEERVAELEAERDRIKAYNAACRKAGKATAEALELLDDRQRADLEHLARHAAYQIGKAGQFPAYALQNLGGNIKRQRDRIEQLRRAEKVQRARGVRARPRRRRPTGGHRLTPGDPLPRQTIGRDPGRHQGAGLSLGPGSGLLVAAAQGVRPRARARPGERILRGAEQMRTGSYNSAPRWPAPPPRQKEPKPALLTADSPAVVAFVEAFQENTNLAKSRGPSGYRVVVVERRKYLAIDRIPTFEGRDCPGQSGVFMVDRATGTVYKIRGYGQRGDRVGDLERMTEQYRAGSATFNPEARAHWASMATECHSWPG